MEPGAPALGALHLILEEGVEQIAVMAEFTPAEWEKDCEGKEVLDGQLQLQN